MPPASALDWKVVNGCSLRTHPCVIAPGVRRSKAKSLAIDRLRRPLVTPSVSASPRHLSHFVRGEEGRQSRGRLYPPPCGEGGPKGRVGVAKCGRIRKGQRKASPPPPRLSTSLCSVASPTLPTGGRVRLGAVFRALVLRRNNVSLPAVSSALRRSAAALAEIPDWLRKSPSTSCHPRRSSRRSSSSCRLR
jgi:hypothetical protein